MNHIAYPKEMISENNEGKTIAIEHDSSFVSFRVSPSGYNGPEALFSRYRGISLMMTRSIGDRLGPCRCIPAPDISAVTIPKNEHVRIIMGTDGMWDVVTNEAVRCLSMLKSHLNPQDFATYLGNKSLQRRKNRGMRMDDITVFCIDVNHDSFVGLNTKMGHEVKYMNDFGCTPACSIQ
jgi:serine/threonine protein phosphatase PrpC